MGLEPTTTGSTGRYSNQLRYNPVKKRGARKPYPPIVSYSPLSRDGVTPGGFTPFDLRTDLGPLYVSTEPRGIGPVSSLLLGVVPVIRVRVVIITTIVGVQFIVIVRVHFILQQVTHNVITTL